MLGPPAFDGTTASHLARSQVFVQARDNPLLLGIFIVTAILVSLFNLATDLTYAIVDPRVELER